MFKPTKKILTIGLAATWLVLILAITANICLAATAPVANDNAAKTLDFYPNAPLPGFTNGCKIGQGQTSCLGTYIQAWYNFTLGVIGILATVMIMYGGFLYLTSQGDRSKAGKGKDVIISSISGLVIALLSYTILQLINPALTTIHMPSLTTIASTQYTNTGEMFGSGGSKINQNSPANPQDIAARPSDIAAAYANGAGALDYANMNIQATTPPGLNLINQYDDLFTKYGSQYGVDPNLLKSICAAESSGNPNAASPAGAQGLMQFMQGTADSLNGGAANLNDPETSIRLAAEYLSPTSNNNPNNPNYGYYLSKNPNSSSYDQIAGYNGGYDNTANSGHALSPSNDCPGVAAYDCTINANGLTETQNYVYNVSSYYQYLKAH